MTDDAFYGDIFVRAPSERRGKKRRWRQADADERTERRLCFLEMEGRRKWFGRKQRR